MEFREQVLDLLAEVAENNIVKENPDVEIFEEGIIDSNCRFTFRNSK